MVKAARSRIMSSSDNPDVTAAKILYELVTEEEVFASQVEEDSANEEYDAAVVKIPQNELDSTNNTSETLLTHRKRRTLFSGTGTPLKAGSCPQRSRK